MSKPIPKNRLRTINQQQETQAKDKLQSLQLKRATLSAQLLLYPDDKSIKVQLEDNQLAIDAIRSDWSI